MLPRWQSKPAWTSRRSRLLRRLSDRAHQLEQSETRTRMVLDTAQDAFITLDRDGVINVDRGYVHRPEQFEFVPGIFQLARFWTNELRLPIIVVI